MVADSKETVSSRYSRTDACMNSLGLGQHTQDLQFHTGQDPSVEKGKWTQSSTSNKKKKKKAFFVRVQSCPESLSPQGKDFSQQPRHPMCPHAKNVIPSRKHSPHMGKPS